MLPFRSEPCPGVGKSSRQWGRASPNCHNIRDSVRRLAGQSWCSRRRHWESLFRPPIPLQGALLGLEQRGVRHRCVGVLPAMSLLPGLSQSRLQPLWARYFIGLRHSFRGGQEHQTYRARRRPQSQPRQFRRLADGLHRGEKLSHRSQEHRLLSDPSRRRFHRLHQ